MRALLFSAVLLVLGACQTLRPPPTGSESPSWPERRATLQAMDAYEFSGQIAAATASQGFSASVTWQQQGRLSELSLRSPLGLGGARVNFDGANLRVTASDGSKVEGEAARAQMVQMVGFEPPLSSLRYWLLGVPDPASEASETLDEVQRLKSLEQNGWFIDYGEYAASSTLPTRLTLHRQALKLKLHITRWRVP